VRHHGFVKVSLAGPIKELLNDRFGWFPEWWDNRDWKEGVDPVHGSRLIHKDGDWLLERHSPRTWAQWLGTEVGRRLDPDCWVRLLGVKWDALRAENPNVRMVVSDVRFNNEALYIQSLGGTLAKIVRPQPNIPTIAKHSSENGVAPHYINAIVHNDGDIQDFELALAHELYLLDKLP
jgi:hypothetical protein